MWNRPNRTARLLAGLPLFAGLSSRELAELAPQLEEIDRSAGRRLIAAGTPGDELFLVLAGELAVSRNDRQLARLGPGALAGEMALMDRQPRRADVTTADDTHLLVAGPRGFAALRRHPVLRSRLEQLYRERIG